MRAGQLSETRFHVRHRGQGPYAEQIASLFDVTRKKLGLANGMPELSTDAFRNPGGRQLELFGR